MADTAAPAPAPKASKPKAPRKKPTHPPASELVIEALLTLKERSGSSVIAIKKYIANKYGKDLAAGWEKRVNAAVKLAVEKGKLVKNKGHFKLAAATKKAAEKPKAEKKPKAAKKPAGEKKPKADKPKKKAESADKPKKPKAAPKKKAEGAKKATAPKKPKAVTKKPAAAKKAPAKKPAAKKATPKK